MVKLLRGFFVAPSPWQVRDLAADMVALMQHLHFSYIVVKKESAHCMFLRLHLDRRPQTLD